MRVSTEHPYVTRVRRAKEVFDGNRNDPAPLYDLHAEDVILHAPGTSPLGGGVRGRANVFARLQRMAELSGGTFEAVSTSLSGNGDFVALQASRSDAGRAVAVREPQVRRGLGAVQQSGRVGRVLALS